MVRKQLDQIPNSAKQGFHVKDEQKQKMRNRSFSYLGPIHA